MARIGKKLRAAREGIDPGKLYTLSEAVEMIKARTAAKFDETIEIAMNLGVDPRHADQNVRGVVNLPHGTGKSVRVAVFARGAKAEEAQKAGADLVGAEDLAERVQAGDMPFDRVIAAPDMMPIVGKLGRVLGPRGLMPNPKVGTVAQDVATAVKNAKAGQVRYRTDKAGIIHCPIGKVEFDSGKLKENLEALLADLQKAKPSAAKGVYLKKISVTTTMGPGLQVDQTSVAL